MLWVALGAMALPISCSEQDKATSPPLSPQEALKSFVLADDDLVIKLVAAEPLVQDPVAMAFDEGGRLWVVEMLGFMKDIDGTGEDEKVGRVSVLFDDDLDGQMDRGTVFLDSLVLPRAIALVEGGILVAENIPLWEVKDTDGDFKADKKILIDSTYGGRGMPEHSANGLLRGLDNWYYNAKSRYRYKKVDGVWKKEETEFRGQWGLAHDDAGRLFYNYNWSQLHADLVPPNALMQNANHTATNGIDHGLTLERKIFPIRSNTAVNRGYVPGTLDAEGKLLEFASACGPIVHRGNALPERYKGDAFVCEPTANLIRQNKIQQNGFMLSAKNAYEDREFLASTDERFRPITLGTGPDGALYVVDMYKGVIQHGPYMTEYLRKETLARGLDAPVHMGRIWRIRAKDKKVTPTLLEEADTSVLIDALGHENGWIRDKAQQLLVNHPKDVNQKLIHLIPTAGPKAQLHALWTLEGRGEQRPEAYLTGLTSKDPIVVQHALRILNGLHHGASELTSKLVDFIKQNYEKAHPLVQMQMVLTAGALQADVALPLSQKFLATYDSLPVARDIAMAALENREEQMLDHLLADPNYTSSNPNHEIFLELLATAIGNTQNEEKIIPLLNRMAAYDDVNGAWVRNALMQGLAGAKGENEEGSLALSRKPVLMDMAWLSPALADKLTWPGKPKKVEDSGNSVKIDKTVYAMGRQKYLNLCANCHGNQGEGMLRFAPPLKNSEWVLGEDYKLAMILLHGIEGPIEVAGKRYDIPEILPNMPSFSTLQNEDIAAIATYIRNAWGHAEEPLSSSRVGNIRFRTQGHVNPWKPEELDTLIFNVD